MRVVDDLTVNVDAARAAGMAALRFDMMDTAGSAAAVLRRIGLGPTGGFMTPSRPLWPVRAT